ncbi:hypothetical protein MKW92_006663 [Papaver armeniacum]|nr:hypothetical protein MKW92_006663 [Papaver armeniacum]
MAFTAWKLHISVGRKRRVVLFGTILFATALVIFPFLQLSSCINKVITTPDQFLKPISSCALAKFPSTFLAYKKHDENNNNNNVTTKMFRELIDMKLLNPYNVKAALCVGEGSASAVSELTRLGFTNATGVKRRHLFSFLMRKRSLIPELDLDDFDCNSFDFVFSRAPSRVSVPALFVLEIERVLKSGGIGAIVLQMNFLNPGNLIRTVTPISTFLKTSDVVHVSSVDPNVDIGVVNSNVTNPFFKSYPMNSRDFNIYLVGHDRTALTSYVNILPGITFVYYPGLARNKIAQISEEVVVDNFFPYMSGEEFDFLVWFKSIVTDGDFVVLKMNAAGLELKFLHQLFETGAICLVDELFLHCPESADTKNGGGGAIGDCVDIFEGLRSSGVFVHQWGRDN